MTDPIQTLTQHRDDLLTAIEREKSILRNRNTVLRTEHGLFLRQGGGFFAPRGILSASLYSPEDALMLAIEIESPTGESPTLMLYGDALREELKEIEQTMEYFTS